jgi:hypothetical protein
MQGQENSGRKPVVAMRFFVSIAAPPCRVYDLSQFLCQMAVDFGPVHSGACGAILDENPNAPVEKRLPCPHCGSVSRSIHVTCSGTLTLHSKLNLKARHANEKRPFMEQTLGDDFHRKGGRWVKFYRLIDRVKDWYEERVSDPATGKVVHECSERLTNHRGHGSAKSRNAAPVKNEP